MPDVIFGLPFQWIRFSKQGQLQGAFTPPAADITDVVIISHGWQTDYDGALSLYQPLIENIARAWSAGMPSKPAGRKYQVLGVLWPSKAFNADYNDPERSESNALSAAAAVGSQDLLAADLHAAIDEFAAFMGADASLIRGHADAAADGGLKQADCVQLMKTLLATLDPGPTDTELSADAEPLTPASAQRVLQSLSAPKTFPVSDEVAHTASVGSVVSKLLRGPRTAIAGLLNKLTFYEMKKRAGIVGTGLARDVLTPLNASATVQRVHLVGHSFGARLVTAAAFAAPASNKWHSLTLLQGAFSHNTMSQSKHGAFLEVYDKISGPTLITHTHRDRACTLAYAIASSLARDNATAIGDAHDEFGAMGANGAQFLPTNALANPQPATGQALMLATRKVHNLLSDAIISSHMDVTNKEVAAVVAHCLAA